MKNESKNDKNLAKCLTPSSLSMYIIIKGNPNKQSCNEVFYWDPCLDCENSLNITIFVFVVDATKTENGEKIEFENFEIIFKKGFANNFLQIYTFWDTALKFWSIFGAIKLRLHTRFQRAFTAWVCIFKVITLVWVNQSNYFEKASPCSKSTLKTRV